jgi:glycosyltransferase involved in cell wall biosynthesis
MTSRLDIGVVIPQLVKYGGAERLLIECLARWQYKHKLTVYATEFNEEVLEEHGVRDGVRLKRLSPQVADNPFAFLLNASFTPKLWSSEIGRHDVYNAHLWPMHLLDIAPCVWYPHEPLRMLHDLRNDKDVVEFASEEERRVHIYPKYNYDTVHTSSFQPLRRATDVFDGTGKPCRIVANSRYCASYLKEVYGQAPSRIVYPGVTPDDFLPPMASEYILTVAQLWPHKRIHLILQSLRLIEDMHLYIVGDGPEKENLISQAKELGVYDRVFFLSGLTNQELRIVFSRALAVVFMPVREPFGIVALEAMAASKPLIAADEGGYVEVVDSGCAFLIPPRVDALAEKITWLKHNPKAGAAMGRHGRELVMNYSWDRTASELLEEIEQAQADWTRDNALTLETPSRGTLFGAQYYGWYGEGLGSAHWNDTMEYGAVRGMPALGYYSSASGDVVEQHLRMAEEMGLDFLVFNLHVDHSGVSERELQSLGVMMGKTAALSSPVRVCVQLCPYECTDADLLTICSHLREHVFFHPNYLLWGGKPLLCVFWTGRYDGDRAFLQALRRATKPALLLTSSLRLRQQQEQSLTLGIFDGWSLFSPLELSGPERWEAVWTEAYASAGGEKIRCATVSPGYDDTAVTSTARLGNPYRSIPRDSGRTYRRMWDFTFKLSEAPDIVFISTFNEFHENTHIEPTVETGLVYLDITRDSIRQGRELWRK